MVQGVGTKVQKQPSAGRNQLPQVVRIWHLSDVFEMLPFWTWRGWRAWFTNQLRYKTGFGAAPCTAQSGPVCRCTLPVHLEVVWSEWKPEQERGGRMFDHVPSHS